MFAFGYFSKGDDSSNFTLHSGKKTGTEHETSTQRKKRKVSPAITPYTGLRSTALPVKLWYRARGASETKYHHTALAKGVGGWAKFF